MKPLLHTLNILPVILVKYTNSIYITAGRAFGI